MGAITAEILSIGDEILFGQTLDTNSHWISRKLDQIGVRVVRKSTIGDNEQDILKAFEKAESKADIILITGGLGPTDDDLTKPTLAKYFNTDLVMNEQWLDVITQYFEERNRKLLDVNRDQALLPANSTMLPNPRGTAPGMWFHEGNKIFVSLPGVPMEMKYLIEHEVIPRLKEIHELPVIYHKIIRTIGIGESTLADILKGWANELPGHIKLAYLPELAEVKLRLTAIGENRDKLANEVSKQVDKLINKAGKYIYGYDNTSIEQVVSSLLKEKKLSLSIAESCSGGYASHLITSLPGSSTFYKGAVIAYSNEIKENILQVPHSILTQYGAVSEQTVVEMAKNVRKCFNTDVGLAISGIAGPDGGTKEKPVGTIWICADVKNSVKTKKLHYNRERMMNIKASSKALLNLLRIQLKT